MLSCSWVPGEDISIRLMYREKRERDSAGEVNFSPASNPGWANRGHPNWAAPIRRHGIVSGSSARVPHREHDSCGDVPTLAVSSFVAMLDAVRAARNQ